LRSHGAPLDPPVKPHRDWMRFSSNGQNPGRLVVPRQYCCQPPSYGAAAG